MQKPDEEPDSERHRNDWPEIVYCSLDEVHTQSMSEKNVDAERLVIIVENVNADKGSLKASISAPSSFGLGIIFGAIFGAIGALAINHYIVSVINNSM
jgi:hypothetical protein